MALVTGAASGIGAACARRLAAAGAKVTVLDLDRDGADLPPGGAALLRLVAGHRPGHPDQGQRADSQMARDGHVIERAINLNACGQI